MGEYDEVKSNSCKHLRLALLMHVIYSLIISYLASLNNLIPVKTIHFLCLLVLLGFFISSCGSHSDGRASVGDTVTTASGLKYVYKVKGTGRKVESGSKVGTYLSLMVNGHVVWNTDQLPDSALTFIQGHDRMIPGFVEMIGLLKEGDQVTAVMPSSIAYGANGAGNVIPPNATLVYDKINVLHVSEPRLIVTDTLLKAISEGGVEQLDKTYQRITTTDSAMYHKEPNAWINVWSQLMDAQDYENALADLNYFEKYNEGNTDLYYYRAMTYDSMGDFKSALESLNTGAATDSTWDQNPRLLLWKQELESKVKTAGKGSKK
jgi:FKBP-type peptidyl-prolyl cis-trans isomerase